MKIIFLYFVLLSSCASCASRGLLSNLQCSVLLNYESNSDSSTACIFSGVFGNTSITFNIIPTFEGLPIDLDSFEILEFVDSWVSRIPPNLLQTFKNTEILIMKNVSLGSVTDLDAGVRLRELFLSHNHIKNIGEMAFYCNKELNYVDLSHNEIQNLKLHTFLYTKKMKYLDLSHNRLKSIPNAFFYLKKLEYLDISYNLLMALYSTDFYGMHDVVTLKIEENLIKEVSPTTFTSMPKLTSLSLRNNSIFDIILNFTNPRIFAVDLSLNFLWELEILQSVRKIDASHNKLSSLILGKNISIHELNLSYNLFKETTSVRQLSSLKRLYMAGNQLTHINHRSFYSLTDLVELNLADNLLKHLDLGALQHMTLLNHISIADNDVSFIRIPLNETVLKDLETIDVTRNSFSCNYLVKLMHDLNERGWRLVSREVDPVSNFLNIPCYNENDLQACRREMDELQVNFAEQITKLEEQIGALYARIENEATRVAGRPFYRKGK
ncbi:leucine-rich repeat protein SHOC-2-like [Culicoides brevitarsis]|uniref:leucine-rich repeat protein SHOC-2-like n=1 Tax=Culicoides brevitarsis TaxID=469753 RepID=UPI00307BE6BC